MDNKPKRTQQKLKTKYCAFPGCGVEFIGRGKAKYCDEHRLAKYRKELYKKNDNNGEANIDIRHDETCATESRRVCDLDGCECEYTFTLIPRVFEYPRFCESHRNEYKRSVFINDHKDN